MPLAESILLLVAILLAIAAGAVTYRLPRLAGARTVTALLVTLAGVLVALAAVAIVDRSWWDVLSAAMLGVGSAVMWDVHLSARAGPPSRMARWHLRRHRRSDRAAARTARTERQVWWRTRSMSPGA